MPYLIQAARRSIARGTLMRHFAGSTRSINCVSAPNAQMRPQYTRPHSIVETTVIDGEQIPRQAVAEDRQVAAEQRRRR